MTSHSWKPCLLSWCLLAACQAGPDEPLDVPAGEQQAEPEPDPAEVSTLAALLRARHVEDLPSAEQLARTPNAEASLRWLAIEADTMLVRTRALALLRHFGSPPTGDLLAALVTDSQAHPALRAAALTGMAGQPLADQPERLELVVAALLEGGDPRVGVAAVQVLDTFAAGRKALREAEQSDQLSPQVRAAIESR